MPLTIVHLTDGSPGDLRDARAAGFEEREAYASARRHELYEALAIAGISPEQCIALGIRDQDAHLHLEEIVERLTEIVLRLQPETVLCPAYEGGHPDHDSAAFAVAQIRAHHSFRQHEYRLYHAGQNGHLNTEDFLPNSGTAPETLELTLEERELKARMICAFRTQARVLSQFTFVDERFRDAPEYDFCRPPHEGRLMYEQWSLPVSGAQWRKRACLYSAG